MESLFNKIYYKKSPTQVFSCEYGKVFECIYFVDICEWLFERFPTRANNTVVTATYEVNKTFSQKPNKKAILKLW